MAPPVLVGSDYRGRQSATRQAIVVVTKDRASMRGFILGVLACLAIVVFGIYGYFGFAGAAFR